MRAKPFLLLLLPLILPLIAQAEPKLSAYEELCLYDRLCSRLRNSDGSKVEPKPAVKKLVETMAEPVHDFAKLYGVDPRAVAGAILAENSMNVQMDDEIQNWIVKNNVWGSQTALDKGMTIGPGQINLEPAMAADKYIASLGLRPARSPEEITKLLLTPAGAAEYSAAIIRQAQDAYKAEGIDISKNPAILVTLYNFGQEKMSYADRAKETAQLKMQPRPNFFGMFVAENIGTVEDAIGWSPEKGRYKKENTELYASGALNMVTDDFTLQTAPPSCSTNGAGDQGQWRARQSWEPFQTFTPRQTKFLEVVGRSIDCQMREWLQLKTVSGELGWMPKSSLASVSEPLQRWQMTTTSCGAPEKDDCVQKALELYGQPKLDGRDNKGKYFLTVKKNDPADPVMPVIRTVALSPYEDQCGYAKYPDLKKQYQSQLNPQAQNNSAKSRADLYTLKGKLDSQLQALKSLLGVKDEYQEVPVNDASGWGTYTTQNNGSAFGVGGMSPGQANNGAKTVKVKKPSNNRYVQRIEQIQRQFDDCLGPANIDCQVLTGEQEFKKFLDTDLKKIKKLADFRALINFDYYLNPVPKNDAQAKSVREKELEARKKQLKEKSDALVKSVRETCAPLESALPAFYQQVKTAVDDMEPLYAQGEFEYILPSFQRVCEQASLVNDFRANGNKLFDGSTEFNCAYRDRLGVEEFTLDFLAKMDLNSDDYLDMLKGMFEEVKYAKRRATRSQQYTTWGPGDLDSIKQMLAACNYNALATARAVEELSKSSCVESILVKDMSLGKNIGGGAKARVVLDTNLQPNQIAFTMKNDCRTDILGRPKNQRPLPFNGGNKE